MDYQTGLYRSLALAQLAPGSLAVQFTRSIGFAEDKTLGATVVGFALVLLSFIIILSLGFAYVQLGELPWIKALFLWN